MPVADQRKKKAHKVGAYVLNDGWESKTKSMLVSETKSHWSVTGEIRDTVSPFGSSHHWSLPVEAVLVELEAHVWNFEVGLPCLDETWLLLVLKKKKHEQSFDPKMNQITNHQYIKKAIN